MMTQSSDDDELPNQLHATLNLQDEGASAFLSDQQLERLAPELHEDEAQRDSLRNLRDLQGQHDAVYTDYLREKQELEDRYEQRFAPIFTNRKAQLDAHPIKLFWFKAFEHCEVLRENITDKDAVALKFLIDVTCDTITKPKEVDLTKPPAPPAMPVGSFTLTFKFADNPFFENDVLSKTYIMHDDDFEELDEARGTKIFWKHGKDLTVRTMKKKTKNGRVLIKKQPTDSFFNFFSPPQRLSEDGDEIEESVLEELDDVLDADYELGDCIRTDVIPRALLYYLNVAEQPESESESENESTGEESSNDDNGDNVGVSHIHDAPNGQRQENSPVLDDGNDDDDESEGAEETGDQKPLVAPPDGQNTEECKQQ